MSYSRWSSSTWYIFWHTDSPDRAVDLMGQLLCVDHAAHKIIVPLFNVEDVMRLSASSKWESTFGFEPTDAEKRECRLLMHEWLWDVMQPI